MNQWYYFPADDTGTGVNMDSLVTISYGNLVSINQDTSVYRVTVPSDISWLKVEMTGKGSGGGGTAGAGPYYFGGGSGAYLSFFKKNVSPGDVYSFSNYWGYFDGRGLGLRLAIGSAATYNASVFTTIESLLAIARTPSISGTSGASPTIYASVLEPTVVSGNNGTLPIYDSSGVLVSTGKGGNHPFYSSVSGGEYYIATSTTVAAKFPGTGGAGNNNTPGGFSGGFPAYKFNYYQEITESIEEYENDILSTVFSSVTLDDGRLYNSRVYLNQDNSFSSHLIDLLITSVSCFSTITNSKSILGSKSLKVSYDCKRTDTVTAVYNLVESAGTIPTAIVSGSRYFGLSYFVSSKPTLTGKKHTIGLFNGTTSVEKSFISAGTTTGKWKITYASINGSQWLSLYVKDTVVSGRSAVYFDRICFTK